MASLDSYHKSYQKVSVVRGHHIYKVVWTPEVGEILHLRTEEGNEHNEHAVAVVKDGLIVGHVPCPVFGVFSKCEEMTISQATESSAMVWKYHVFIPSIPTLVGRSKEGEIVNE